MNTDIKLNKRPRLQVTAYFRGIQIKTVIVGTGDRWTDLDEAARLIREENNGGINEEVIVIAIEPWPVVSN